MRPEGLLAKVIPFHTRRSREAATYVLALSARWQRISKVKPWLHPRAQPERLGNLLQQLTVQQPAVVFVIEKVVADIVTQLEGTSSKF